MTLKDAVDKLKAQNIDLIKINELDIANALNIDLDKAKEIATSLKVRNRSDAFDFFESGIKKARSKNDIGALNDFNKAVQLDPDNSLFISERGNVKYFLKDFDGACKDWLMAKQKGNLGEREKEVDELIEKFCKNKSSNIQDKKKQKEGCYIATALYGSYESEEVIVLRRFRDNVLKRNFFGKIFIEIYYFISPYFVKLTKNISPLNYLLRLILDRFVKQLKS